MNHVSPTFDLFFYLCFVDFIGYTEHSRGELWDYVSSIIVH